MMPRKKKMMKMMLVMMMVGLLMEIAVAIDQKNYSDSPSYYMNKHRKETRSARDFRPGPLSTAPGFGKRKDPFVSRINTNYGRPQSVTLVSATYPTKRTMTYWFLQHMRRYPDISTSSFKIELLNSKKNNRLMTDQLLKMTDSILFI